MSVKIQRLREVLAVKSRYAAILRKRCPLVSASTSFFVGEAEALTLADLLGRSEEDEERNFEAFERLLRPCQERPQCLDASLERLTNCLIKRLKSPYVSRSLYLLCKIRGRKAVARTLPRHVFHLEEALGFLDAECWETRYVALVWLSLLVLVPFALDSILDTDMPIKSIIAKCECFLQESKPTREPAALCLARLFSRPDCQTEVEEFVFRPVKKNEIGLLLTKAEVFKRGGGLETIASELLVSSVLPEAEHVFLHPGQYSSVERKLHLKLLQRVFAAGREQRAELLERIVGLMVGNGLSDSDSIVRWSAAKGVGRVCEHMQDTDMQTQVVESVISLFEVDDGLQDEATWHGASLALAELSRRHLVRNQDHILGILTECVTRALKFDFRRGTRTLGSNVRDAACYVAWALVRNVPPDRIAPHSRALYRDLVITSLFDREVSCRRAAAAALQECVGRLGRTNFPKGIETIQVVDYQNIGNVQSSYLEYSVTVAKLENHDTIRQELVEHLLNAKMSHWDEQIRSLASQALGRLCDSLSWGTFDHFPAWKDRRWEWLKALVAQVTGSQQNRPSLHGALLAIAEVLRVLDDEECNQESTRAMIGEVLRVAESQRFDNLFTFDDVRQSWCRLVEVAASKQTLNQTMREQSLDTSLMRALDSTSSAAPSASSTPISADMSLSKQQLRNQAKQALVAALTCVPCGEHDLTIIKSAADALQVPVIHAAIISIRNGNREAAFLLDVLVDRLGKVVRFPSPTSSSLRTGSESKKSYQERVEAVQGLGDAWQCSPSSETKSGIIQLLVFAMDDHQSTNQGDVGSWVRKEACETVQIIMQTSKNEGLEELQRHSLLAKSAFLSCEKLDHVREAALKLTLRLLDASSRRHVQQTDDAYQQGLKRDFDICTRMLFAITDQSIRQALVHGLALTAGSLSESCSQAARQALYKWGSANEKNLRETFSILLDAIFKDGKRESRLVPLLKTLAWLMLDSPSPILPVASSSDAVEWAQRMQSELRKLIKQSKSVSRLIAASRVLVGMGAAGHAGAWQDFATHFLAHPFPVVRKQAAEAFYLWSAGVIDPSETIFNKEGGDLEKCMDVIAGVMNNRLDDDNVTQEELSRVRQEFQASCPTWTERDKIDDKDK